MTAVTVVLGFAAVLAAAAVGVSLFAVWRSQVLAELSDRRAQARVDSLHATVEGLQKAVASQAAFIQDLQNSPLPGSAPAPRMAGLNLTKRSQVLRMHRNGDDPERIATLLEVPRQEVDLLIKVHRIVLTNH